MTIEVHTNRNGYAVTMARDEICLTITKYRRRIEKVRIYTIRPSAIAKAIVRKILAII